ncbi:MAG: hypothetical protein Q9166_008120 [cf. Caloplaca sp. 2 TL-2023]
MLTIDRQYQDQTPALHSPDWIASWIRERKNRFPTAEKQALKVERLLQRQKQIPNYRALHKDKQNTAVKAKIPVKDYRQIFGNSERELVSVTSLAMPHKGAEAADISADGEIGKEVEDTMHLPRPPSMTPLDQTSQLRVPPKSQNSSKPASSPRKPKTPRPSKSEQMIDPGTLKKLNHFTRRHKFVTEESFTTYTTSQRRAFERDVYDYARALGFSRTRAKASVLTARKLCGEEEYNSDDTRLDDDEMDDSSVILVSLPASTGRKSSTSNLARSFSAGSPSNAWSRNLARTGSEIMPSIEIQETPTRDVGKGKRNRPAKVLPTDRRGKRRKSNEGSPMTLNEAYSDDTDGETKAHDSARSDKLSSVKDVKGPANIGGYTPIDHHQSREKDETRNNKEMESVLEQEPAGNVADRQASEELGSYKPETEKKETSKKHSLENENEKRYGDQGIIDRGRELIRAQDATRRAREEKEKMGISGNAHMIEGAQGDGAAVLHDNLKVGKADVRAKKKAEKRARRVEYKKARKSARKEGDMGPILSTEGFQSPMIQPA